MMPPVHDLPQRLRTIRADIRAEYVRDHKKPWIIGFSGGKDSTLLAHLVVDMLLNLAPDQRVRPVHILSNDTLVESPVFQASVDSSLRKISEGVAALGLPIQVVKTHPDHNWTFWVNMLGRGYPAPNRNFRWCTDRMKIRPTTLFIREQVSASGEVTLLLGVRKAESQARAQRISRYTDAAEGNKLSPHNDIAGCLIFRPIENLSDEDVWHVLLNLRPPWGGDHRELITMYRNAKGGECPFVMADDDAPSCGSTSARFGCWTCTVVSKDSSLDGLVESGFDHLEPLGEFRERLRQVSEDPAFRSKVRRNGQPGLGPLTIQARQMLLSELLELQNASALPLITDHEIRLIKDWWGRDESVAVIREMERLVQLTIGGAL